MDTHRSHLTVIKALTMILMMNESGDDEISEDDGSDDGDLDG